MLINLYLHSVHVTGRLLFFFTVGLFCRVFDMTEPKIVGAVEGKFVGEAVS